MKRMRTKVRFLLNNKFFKIFHNSNEINIVTTTNISQNKTLEDRHLLLY